MKLKRFIETLVFWIMVGLVWEFGVRWSGTR